MSFGNLKRALRKIAEHKQFVTAYYGGSNGTIWNEYVTFIGPIHQTTGTLGAYLLTGVPQGQTGATRIGDKVTGTSLRITASTWPDPYYELADPNQWIRSWFHITWRMVIFIWKDDTTPVTKAELFVPVNIGHQQPIEPYDIDFKVKSKILLDIIWNQHYDWTFTPDGAGDFHDYVTSANNLKFAKVFRINLTKLRRGMNTINYQGGTVTGVNNIYVWIQSNIVPEASATITQRKTWNYHLTSDYRFIDM